METFMLCAFWYFAVLCGLNLLALPASEPKKVGARVAMALINAGIAVWTGVLLWA